MRWQRLSLARIKCLARTGDDMDLLTRIFDGSTERHVVERGKKIIDQAVAENKMLARIANGSNDLSGVKTIESNADKEVFEIANSVTSGAIAPNLVDDMLRFVNREDDIVDALFNLARVAVRYKGSNKKADEYVKSNLLMLSNLINNALVLLYEMHKVQTLEQARKLRERIEQVEQKGDDIKDSMLDYAAKTKGIDFKSFHYIQSVAFLADEVLDGCEDTSDMIESMMRSILT